MQSSPLTYRRLRLVALMTVAVFSFTASGCFNTYHFEREEFAKLQQPDGALTVVQAKGGREVAVGRDTALYVRSVGGRRYPVTAVNFKLTESQWVASDRDPRLMVNELQDSEADLLSTWKTVLLITAGAGAVAGLIVGVALTADSKTAFTSGGQ